MPDLAGAGLAGVLDGQRWLVVRFSAVVAVGLGLFAAGLVLGWHLLLFPATWLVYGGSVTAVHHLIHGPLGLSDRGRHLLRAVLAGVVLESGHALAATHRAHHSTDPDTPDPEGWIEHVSWTRMAPAAFAFRYRLLWWGWVHGDRRARLGVVGHLAAHAAGLALLPWTWWPVAYLVAMALASASFAVLAGKGPQTNWGRPVASPLVRIRSRVTAPILFSHDRHLEHHAYPEVPLPRLRRLDPVLQPVLDRLATVEVVLP